MAAAAPPRSRSATAATIRSWSAKLWWSAGGLAPSARSRPQTTVRRMAFSTSNRPSSSVLRARLRDLPVQQVVQMLVLAPARGCACLRKRLPHRRDVVEGGVKGGLAGDLRLQDQPGPHHVGRVGTPGDLGNGDRLADRPRADEGSFADMAPDAAVLLQHGERLAQIAARHAQALAQLALRRQPAVARLLALREIGLQLHQRGMAAVCLSLSSFPSHVRPIPDWFDNHDRRRFGQIVNGI